MSRTSTTLTRAAYRCIKAFWLAIVERKFNKFCINGTEMGLVAMLKVRMSKHNQTLPGTECNSLVRLEALSLVNIDDTWNLTVCSEMPKRRAIALLPNPSASMPKTSFHAVNA